MRPIDADALIEFCAERWIPLNIDAVNMQPTIQPEQYEGHWILYDKRFPWSKDYKCSECGNYINLSGINGGRGDAKYCPNCGAKMKGELDEQ